MKHRVLPLLLGLLLTGGAAYREGTAHRPVHDDSVLGFQHVLRVEARTPTEFEQDFDFVTRRIAATYAYFDAKATRWSDVPELYAADLRRVTNREEFIVLLERVIEELYDHHAQLIVNLEHSPRLVPSGTDLCAEWREDRAIITQVRENSDAERACLRHGTVVVEIDGVPIVEAVEGRLGRSYPGSVAAARDWALRALLAGRRSTPRVLQVEEHGIRRTVELPAADQLFEAEALLEAYEIRPGIGYIRFNNSLGNGATVAAFDRALNALRQTRGLIIDLRDTPSGGNSSVARGILGRFVKREQPYQKHELTLEERGTGIRRSWFELVSPRGDFAYSQPVAVLVNRWTGSMGEGLAIGFDATGTATVVGTPMAGLVGATMRITLPSTGIGINLPTERLYHVNGTPREEFQPVVLVDVAGAGPNDEPFMSGALQVLMKQ
jgi:C-terminal processing protease CtpA/Prc